MRFRHKPVDVDAVQWSGGNAHELMQFVGRLADNSVGFRISLSGGASVFCQAQDGWLNLPLGDWVVRTVHGHNYVMSDKSFKEQFSPLPSDEAAHFDSPVDKVLCQHDWRVNPFITYATYPPMKKAVCLRCSAAKMVQEKYLDPSADPLTWPKYND